MEKKKWVLIEVIAIILVFVSIIFDAEIVKVISLLRNNFLNDFFLGVTSISSSLVVFFFLTSLFLWKEHKRKWILPLWLTLFLSAFVSFTLKILIQRQRPFQQGIVETLAILQKQNHLIWNFSFPSFHAMLVFCAVPILSKEFPKFRYFWIILASLVAFSRVYFGLHFLSDIIAGGLIGCVLGAIIIRIEQKNKYSEKIYKKIFKRK